jgi:tRNA A-37 threonylcarbamoyl transferase component Bud32/tetratricopeptide (TPR) repeat protein
MSTPCLKEETLMALHAGRLGEAELSAAAQHLDQCPQCLAHLQRLENTPIGAISDLAREAERGATTAEIVDRTFETAGSAAKLAIRFELPLPYELPGYTLLEKLGRGGMGVVYKARQHRLQRLVAVKLLAQFVSPEAEQRFLVEAQAAASLDHPGIVPIYEIVNTGDLSFYAMALVEGESLQQRLLRELPGPAETARLMRQVCAAVDQAHAKGLVHRDLKPANVLLARDGAPKVTDFGLARRLDGVQDLTLAGEILGTPGYMSPEQAAGKTDQIDARTDIYGLGAILYCMLTGQPPHKGATPAAIIAQVLEQDAVPPHVLRPGVDRDLETICLKCLERNASQRYPTAAALGDEFQRLIDGDPIHARPISSTARLVRSLRRHPLIASLTAATALLLMAVAAIGYVLSESHARGKKQAAEFEREKNESARLKREAFLQTTEAAMKTAEAKQLESLAEERTAKHLAELKTRIARELAILEDIIPTTRSRAKLRDLLEEVLDKAKEWPKDLDIQRSIYQVRLVLGRNERQLGDLSKACELFQQNADLTKELIERFPDARVELQKDLATHESVIGRTSASMGKFREAYEHLELALESLQRAQGVMESGLTDDDAKYRASSIYDTRATVRRSQYFATPGPLQGEPEQTQLIASALADQRRAMELREAFPFTSEEQRFDAMYQLRRNLVETLSLSLHPGDSGAEELLKESDRIVRDCRSTYEQSDLQRHKINWFETLFQNLQIRAHWRKIDSDWGDDAKQALRLADELVRDNSENPLYYASFGKLLEMIASHITAPENPTQALKELDRGLQLIAIASYLEPANAKFSRDATSLELKRKALFQRINEPAVAVPFWVPDNAGLSRAKLQRQQAIYQRLLELTGYAQEAASPSATVPAGED